MWHVPHVVNMQCRSPQTISQSSQALEHAQSLGIQHQRRLQTLGLDTVTSLLFDNVSMLDLDPDPSTSFVLQFARAS